MIDELPADLDDDERSYIKVLDDLAAAWLAPQASAIEETARIDRALLERLDQQGLLAIEQAGTRPLLLSLLTVERLARISAAVACRVAAAHACALAAAEAGADAAWLLTRTVMRRCSIAEGADLTATPVGPDGRLLLRGHAPRVEGSPAVVVALARTGDGQMAPFAVELDRPGVQVSQQRATTGVRGLDVRTVAFREVAVAQPDKLPGADLGRRLHQYRLLSSAAASVGVAARAAAEAEAYVADRLQFGRRLADFAAVRALLATLQTDVLAAANLVWSAAHYAAISPSAADHRVELAAAAAGRAAVEVTRGAVQLHGGYGYITEQPVERTMRDAISLRARSGSGARLLAAAIQSPTEYDEGVRTR
jgi:alkylation response protein AidB-like acyl-CoA dehydrogenase